MESSTIIEKIRFYRRVQILSLFVCVCLFWFAAHNVFAKILCGAGFMALVTIFFTVREKIRCDACGKRLAYFVLKHNYSTSALLLPKAISTENSHCPYCGGRAAWHAPASGHLKTAPVRKLLANALFWNNPANGAVFALTLAGVGSVLWLGFFHILLLLDIIFLPWQTIRSDGTSTEWPVWIAGQLLIWLYSLAVLLRAGWRLGNTMRQNRNLRPLCWLLAALLCAAAGGAGIYLTVGVMRHIWVTFFCWSIVMDGAAIAHIPIFQRFQNFFGFTGSGWAWIFCGAMLCLAAAYLSAAKLFTSGGNLPLRRAFGRATLVLWGLFVIGYIASLGSALYVSNRAAAAEAAAAHHFQRPLTAAGLERMYRESGIIDGGFWERSLAAEEKLPRDLTLGKRTYFSWGFQLPDRLTPEIIAAFEQYCAENAEVLAAWESGWDATPPLPERKFESGNLDNLSFATLANNHSLARMEISRLQTALRGNNLAEALKVYTRLTNCGAVLRHEPCLIGGLTWLRVEALRLNGAEKLLESRLLSDLQLAGLDDDFAKLEPMIPQIHQQTLYSELVSMLDAFHGLETGKLTEEIVALGAFRWFLPLLWTHAALDKEYLIRAYPGGDPTAADTGYAAMKLYLLSAMNLPALSKAENRVYAFTARVRAVRALIRAELHRRKYGSFPETLDQPPVDPFTGKPMQYRVTETTIAEWSWENSGDRWEESYQLRPVRALQVWSAGPDRKDDGGADYLKPGTNEPIRFDDVRALVRLPETPR